MTITATLAVPAASPTLRVSSVAPTAIATRPTVAASEVLDSISRTATLPSDAVLSSRTLRDNEDSLRERLRLIASARESIVMSTYYIYPDASGNAVIDALEAAARRGVRVMISLDDFAERVAGPFLFDREPRERMQQRLHDLERAGAVIGWYGGPVQQRDRIGTGNHFKSMVVDNRFAILGGRNIGNEYFQPGRWRDFEQLLEGPIAARIALQTLQVLSHGDPILRTTMNPAEQRQRFAAYWTQAQQEALREHRRGTAVAAPSAPRAQLVYSDPSFGTHPGEQQQDNPITLAFIRAIDAARTSVLVSTNYINGDSRLREALMRASRRGVRVDVITTGQAASQGMASVIHAGCEMWFYPQLRAASVHLHETVHQEHGKMLLIDDRLAAFGSYNLEQCSHQSLVEGTIFTDDPTMVGEVRRALRDTLQTNTVSLDHTRQRSVWEWIRLFFLALLALIIRPAL